MRSRTRRTRPQRVAYVLPAPIGPRSPLEAVETWTDTTDLLGALRSRGLRPVAVWRTGSQTASIVWRGVSHRFVPDDRLGLRAALAVRALRPDVIHVNSFLRPVPTALLRLACPRARLVVQHHGERPASSGRTALAQRVVGRLVDAVAFTGADEQAEPWRQARALGRRTTVTEVLEAAPSVAALPVAEARSRTGMTGDPAVVWVGRLIDGKDPEGAVRAFGRAFGDRSSARLWMVCTNRDGEAAVRAAIGAAGLGGRVTLVGPVPHDEMAAWLSGAELFLATSRREGSGYALLEAVACGCTPVVSDIGPHAAIVGGLGRRFAAGDEVGAAAGLLDAAASPVPRHEVRCHSAIAHSWAAIADQLLAAYGGS